jgi:hypothetical protein
VFVVRKISNRQPARYKVVPLISKIVNMTALRIDIPVTCRRPRGEGSAGGGLASSSSPPDTGSDNKDSENITAILVRIVFSCCSLTVSSPAGTSKDMAETPLPISDASKKQESQCGVEVHRNPATPVD